MRRPTGQHVGSASTAERPRLSGMTRDHQHRLGRAEAEFLEISMGCGGHRAALAVACAGRCPCSKRSMVSSHQPVRVPNTASLGGSSPSFSCRCIVTGAQLRRRARECGPMNVRGPCALAGAAGGFLSDMPVMIGHVLKLPAVCRIYPRVRWLGARASRAQARRDSASWK
jgi:hypothetical protein